MSLRKKFVSIFLLIFLLLGIINLFLQKYIIFPGFKSIEKVNSIKEFNRALNVFKKEIKHIDSVCKDWSYWDDTYNYVKNKNKSYENSNLVTSSFKDLKLNIIGIYDANGNVVWLKFYDLKSNNYVKPQNIFSKTQIINFLKKYPKGISGIYKKDNKIIMLSLNPILKSDYSGPPDGIFLMGRFLNKDVLNRLKKETKLEIFIKKITPESPEFSIEYLKDFIIVGKSLKDIFNKPIIKFSVKIEKKITDYAKKVINIEIFAFIVLCLIVIIILSYLIDRLIITPIEKLKNFVKTKNGEKLILEKDDEIGILSKAINDFIEKIRKQNKELIELNEKLKKDIELRIKVENELKKSKQIVERLKRMESLALLAGGVAHDLNNILSGIVVYPEMLLMSGENLTKKQKKILNSLIKAGDRAARVVGDLLDVTRTIEFTTEIINLNDLIREFLNSLEFKNLLNVNKEIILETNFEKDLYLIEGSKVHITKAIMNLISNAIDSIESKGKIKISTKNLHLKSSLKNFMEIPPNKYAIIEIEDTGKGIPDEILDRIFEPFFTTKKQGKSGTGLGLFIVWNTIKAHNGYVDVNSSPKGTKFTLYFPKTDKKPTEIKKDDGKLIDGNNEKIVVIEDEEEQQEIFRYILEYLNFSPVIFEKNKDAIEFLKVNSSSIVILKGINEGYKLAEEILKINPDQKILIVSDYVSDELIKKFKTLGIKQFISKPISVNSLSDALKKLNVDK